MLDKGVGDIEDVLEGNTKRIKKGLRRLRAKLEENTRTLVPQTTEEDEEYPDDDSSEEEMEHLDNSAPITLMASSAWDEFDTLMASWIEYDREEARK